jgi:hypothetical protein
MAGRYAERTQVNAEKSQQEIVGILRRYGADGFVFGEDNGRAVVGFRAHGRMVRFVLSLDVDRAEFARTPTGLRRSQDSINRIVEGEHRRRWRALVLVIKAKLEVVETGITSFEREFLANIVLPNGSTVGEWVEPQIELAYESNTMPALLPGLSPVELDK